MWSSCRRVLQPAAVRSFCLTPAQSTVVVERWWSVPLSKVGSPPRLHPRRHRIYKLVENTTQTPTKKMELILTQTVPSVGGRGDTVMVKKSIGRNKLLPQGLAVYPSPENKQIFAEERRVLREGNVEDRVQTRTGLMTVEFLKRTKLNINQMPSEEFDVTKEVICRQFRKKLGVVVPPHAITFPFESVKDLGDYWCEIAVNGMNTVRVPVSVVPYENLSASYKQQLKEQTDADTSEPAAAADVEAEVAAADAASDAAEQTAASDAAEQTSASDAAEQTSASDAAQQTAASDAVFTSAAAKDSESQVGEASASTGSEDTAASSQESEDTTARPADGPKKD